MRFRDATNSDCQREVPYPACAMGFMASSCLTLICERRDLQSMVLLELKFPSFEMVFSCLADTTDTFFEHCACMMPLP